MFFFMMLVFLGHHAGRGASAVFCKSAKLPGLAGLWRFLTGFMSGREDKKMIERILKLPRWLRFSVIGLLTLMLTVWLLARFWLPEFARQKGEAILSEALHRPVTIGAVQISPFALRVAVDRLVIGQREARHGSQPLFSFDRFELNLSVASLWYRAPVVSAVRLSGPQAYLVRDPDGRFNFSDLLESSGPKDAAPAPLPDFSLSNIELGGGKLVFDDREKKTQQTVSELALGIPFAGTLGTEEESWVEPHFRARLDDSLLELKGKLKPFADRREATLAVHLKDLDLTRVAAYVPPVDGLKLLSARLDVDLDLAFVQIPGKPYSLMVTGDSALRQLAVENRGGAPYVVAADRLALKLSQFDATLGQPLKAALQLDQLTLRARDGKTPLLVLPKLSAGGAVIDLKGQRADLAALEFEQLRLDLRREKDGQIDLVRLLTPVARTKAADPAPVAKTDASPASPGDRSLAQGDSLRLQKNEGNAAGAAPAPRENSRQAPPGWTGRIERVALKDARLSFADQTVDKAPPLRVEGLTLNVEGLDLSGKEPARLDLVATVNQRGRLAIAGNAGWAPLAASLKLDLAELDLVPLQGWAGGKLNALLTRGGLSIGGQLTLAGQPLVVSFEGDGKLGNFNLFDRQNAADVINFRGVELVGLRFVSTPLAVDLKRLTLDELFARVILGADGQLNLKQLVKSDPAPTPPAAVAAPEGGSALAADPAANPAARPAADLPVKIGEIVVKKSRIDFTDQFIKPSYRAGLTGLEGKITALAAGQRGLIDLRGAVDRSAPLSISGEVDPFSAALFLNVAARVKGVDMPAMSPYAERYLGYQLSKGKLSFDVKYFVENSQLKAENSLFLDQLTFGDKVESPEALSVPVTLAVALLKNTRGEIDLNLPVSGSLNDPEFSVARIVFKVLGNLIVKAVSSPFALLGAAFGGGEELSQVDFEAGRARLEADGEKRLGILAKALLERPGLTLEITGQADPQGDRQGLALAMLDRQLKAQKVASSAKKGQDSAALRDIVLSPEERLQGLVALAEEQDLKLPKGAAAADYQAALLAGVKVGDDELRQLAERRGRGVRNWLVDTGKVPVERVFVMVPRLETGGDAKAASRAVFSVR